jgi:hypothetical protein
MHGVRKEGIKKMCDGVYWYYQYPIGKRGSTNITVPELCRKVKTPRKTPAPCKM